jgi:hypothetical protein
MMSNQNDLNSLTGDAAAETGAVEAIALGRRKRRFRRFVAMLGASVLLLLAAAATVVWLPYYREQRVVSEVHRLRGKVLVSPLGGPVWLRQAVGNNYRTVFDRVIAVDLIGTSVDDSDLRRLREFKFLHHLSLENTRAKPLALQRLAELKELRFLNLDSTDVTAEDLAQLAGLPNLEELSLCNAVAITDEGIEHLAAARNLEWLVLTNNMGTTAAGRKKLQTALPECQILFRR